MIITQEEADVRLASKDNLSNLIEVRPMKISNPQPKVPEMVRALLGGLANSGEDTLQDIEDAFGVSKGTISKYSRGMVAERLDPGLSKRMDESKERSALKLEDKVEVAHGLALDSLMESLVILKPKLTAGSDLPADKLSRIAAEMSKIARNLTPEDKGTKINNTQVIFYKPEMKPESTFETIEA